MLSGILRIFGIIFLIVIADLGYTAYTGFRLNASSIQYGNEAVPAIFQDWNYAELKKRAHPSLFNATPEQEVEKVFHKSAQLGKLENFSGCQGGANYISSLSGNNNNVSANYSCHVKFANDTADIILSLMPDTQGEWKIAGIKINPSHFVPTN